MTPPGRVVVIGLGPAGADLLVPAARAALERIRHRYARTAHHPAADELTAAGMEFETFDAFYEAAGDLEAVYASIASTLLAAAATHGEVAYAVPGSPATAERTVALLRESGVDLEIVPGLSFAELAWVRLGVDPLRGARVVDGRELATSAAATSGPLLIAQCDSRLILSEVKLTLLDALDGTHPVTVLQRLGLPDESVFDVPLADLDRAFEPDHLTALFVDTGEAAIAPEFARLVALAERLRGPGGCPWDAAQTHHSLARHLLEEAYEVVEAIEALPADAPGADASGTAAYAALEDELGDLLFQVVIHAVLAAEAGAFTIADVSRGIHDKLVRRHPHVFGDAEVDGAEEVVVNWEQIKRAEKEGASLAEDAPSGFPSLLYVHKLYRKAAAVGFEAGDELQARRRLAAAVESLAGAAPESVEVAIGEVLAATVAAARAHSVDAESALRGWARRFRDRFAAVERRAADQGVDLAVATPAAVAALWDDAGAPPT